jgi:hypothetical protein
VSILALGEIMPYIPKDNRHDLLESSIHELMNLEMSSGDMNFIISSLIWSKFNKNKKYATANELMGILECVKMEFYRRMVAPYEDMAIQKNGDLDVFS